MFDSYRFGRLVSDLVHAGAYSINYSPKRKTLFAWFRGPAEKNLFVRVLVSKHGKVATAQEAKNGAFTMFAIPEVEL